ncbi:LLM class flavin-dependent oxidoreductase [Baekduia soli]|uniref:LLM class flavin-dependent oxidoreductase n=1 Tax=Baekduia soli TaxID=496014 RepID=A0A5B8U4N3_9ACTN|nr:LLM class flavin-dependent oxidoreductase [Baekduia soli]QEC48076.1 LLM class flavin-dependent oxidoreductase [Baekduia soli]
MVTSGGPRPLRGVCAFAPSLDAMTHAAHAADEAGFDSVWTCELYNRSATVTLAAAAMRTRNCRIGSGVIYGVGRSPLMLAAEARDLDELSGGRMVLGIGNGTRRMISDWHGLDGDAPAVRMEELVPLLRRIWNLHEGPIKHDGRFYHLHIQGLDDLASPPERDIPIYTAGVNPRMIESAGRVADGLLGHTLLSPRYITEVVRPAIDKGARHAERDPAEVKVATYTLASANEDEEQARRDAAAMIAFYGSVKSYGLLFDVCGFAEEAKAIQGAFRQGDVDGMIAAVTDAMLDEFALAGTPQQVAEALSRFDGVADEVVLSPPTFRVPAERVAHNLALLTEHCAPGNG